MFGKKSTSNGAGTNAFVKNALNVWVKYKKNNSNDLKFINYN